MPSDKVTLKIPRPLYEHLKTTIKGSGFGSVNEFVVFVLRELTSSAPAKDQKDSSGLTKQEVEIVKQRLKNLGYL
jgi:hypothetical protein